MYGGYLLVAFITLWSIVKSEPSVDTSHGKIAGKVLKTLIKNVEYAAFMGIPYAEPPIKDLRFMPPQSVKPWDGVLKATTVKPACIQFNNNIKKGQPLGHYGAEDCLYLDIFTPGLDENKRAVIVYIYNHNFYESYNKTEDYAPDFFIEEDIVIVTISHRLSAFGFLSLEDESMPGNAGLRDLVLGLEWINGNIEKFGGDRERITLMGSQGGAAAVDLLMHSTAKKLFSAAILQGGSSWSGAYLHDNVRERAFNLGEVMNRTASSGHKLIAKLNEVPPDNIVSKDFHACQKEFSKEYQRSIVTFGPVVEKQPDGLITEYPEDSEQQIDIPIMIGYNSCEGMDTTLYYLLDPRFFSFLHKDFPFILPRRLKFRFDPYKDAFYDAVDEIKSHYFNNKFNKKTIPNFGDYTGDVLTAYSVNCAVSAYAKRSRSPIYYYHFDLFSDFNENKLNIMKLSSVEGVSWGAAGTDELCYLFKCPDLKETYLKHDNTMSEDRKTQMKIVKLWSNFAKYRNPTPDNDETLAGLKWSPYTVENEEYLHIDNDFKMKTELNKSKFKFWDDFISRWEKKAVNGVISEPLNRKDEL